MHDLSRPDPTAVSAALIDSPAGLVQMPPRPFTLVAVHVGASVDSVCRRGAERYRGLETHGAIDIIPAGTPSEWEIKQSGRTLVIRVPDGLLEVAAAETGLDASRIAIANRFQIRDPHIEHIAWAVKAELEAGSPSPGGRLFIDSLGTALAARLLDRHSALALAASEPLKGGLAGYARTRVLAYIDDHLDRDLSLIDIAAVADLSVSHLKTLFRQSMGSSVHQYVIRRRVDRAAALLRAGQLSTTDVALATGFAHQSHLARHMRRLLGVTPAAIRPAARRTPQAHQTSRVR